MSMQKNLTNNIQNISFNPREMSREQLLEFIKLKPNATEEEIINKIKELIKNQDDPNIVNFLYLILYLLLKEPDNMAGQVFNQEYLGRRPQNSTVLGTDNFVQVQTTNPSDFAYNVQVEQGKKNPRYVEIYKSYLIINSALRPDPMTTPSEIFTLDVDFTNVLSIRLNSILIPPSWYNFDHTFANVSFALIDSVDGYLCVNIVPGHYGLLNISADVDLINVLNTTITSNGNKVETYVIFSWNEAENKISIVGQRNVQVVFFDPLQTFCDLSNCEISSIPRLNYNLGYYLGFRGPKYNNEDILVGGQEGVSKVNWENNKLIIDLDNNGTIVKAFAQVNLNTSINAILNIHDFNKNTFTNKIHLLSKRDNILQLPSYYNESIPCKKTGNIPGNKNITVFTQNPRKLTSAELYTIQEILNQDANSYFQTAVGSNVGNSLATFNLQSNLIFNKSFGAEDNTSRIYTGAIDLGRIQVSLTTSNGIPLNLNFSDWECSLEIEQHYQNLNTQG